MIDLIPTLIVAKPSRLREGLRTLIGAEPRLELVGQADNGPAALQLIADYAPLLILLDANLPSKGAWDLLSRVKAESSQTYFIVLVDNTRQQQAAIAAGADAILMTGFPITRFFALITELALVSKQPEKSLQP